MLALPLFTCNLAISRLMKKYNVAMTEEMERRLEVERKKKALDSIPEAIRYILSEYLAKS
jgi:Arc/MetJ-type ribon-helix-helix transcriptional regulator